MDKKTKSRTPSAFILWYLIGAFVKIIDILKWL